MILLTTGRFLMENGFLRRLSTLTWKVGCWKKQSKVFLRTNLFDPCCERRPQRAQGRIVIDLKPNTWLTKEATERFEPLILYRKHSKGFCDEE